MSDRSESAARNRIDKWLWFARVVKSRTLASALVKAGKVRVNAERRSAPSSTIVPGDVLTITLEREVKVLRVMAPGRTPRPRNRSAHALRGPHAAPVAEADGSVAAPIARQEPPNVTRALDARPRRSAAKWTGCARQTSDRALPKSGRWRNVVARHSQMTRWALRTFHAAKAPPCPPATTGYRHANTATEPRHRKG